MTACARCLLLTVVALWATAVYADSAGAILSVSATVLSKNVCKFSVHALPLDFQTIDPAATTPRTATQPLEFVCNGSSASASWFVSADDGQHRSAPGARRMQHQLDAGEFLSYALAVSPQSGIAPKGVTQTLTLTGSVAPADFQNAAPGAYLDTVVITVAP